MVSSAVCVEKKMFVRCLIDFRMMCGCRRMMLWCCWINQSNGGVVGLGLGWWGLVELLLLLLCVRDLGVFACIAV